MKEVPFKASSTTSVGVELEFQLINPLTGAIASRAKDLIRNVQDHPMGSKIKPEITQGMIEINSSVHRNTRELHDDLFAIRNFLGEQAEILGVNICGGGTHPFQKWSLQKIFPSTRFKTLSKRYRYLSKRSTIFGQHVHVGCANGDEAMYLTHALARYVPQFIAIAASSPFFQRVDTKFQSCRSNDFSAFPTSGVAPFFTNWETFNAYFNKMKNWGVVQSMKDFYWDVRPKPEFGTVEIRVCDTPLNIETAVLIASYIQTIAHYLLQEKPFEISHDLYYLYPFNRFQSCRYGFEGDFLNPLTNKHISIGDDILATLKLIEKHTTQLGTTDYLLKLAERVKENKTDANLLRNVYEHTNSLPEVVKEQCRQWRK